MCIVELIPTGDGQIMETLDSVAIKLFVLAALKEGREEDHQYNTTN